LLLNKSSGWSLTIEGYNSIEEAKYRIPPPMRAVFYDILDLLMEAGRSETARRVSTM